jgi:hypothetical protein
MATDGTATVMGRKTGVGVQLKSKYAPLILQTLSSGRLHKKLVTGSPFFAYRTHT